MEHRLLVNPATRPYALLAGELVRVRALIPAPPPSDPYAVLATGAHLREEVAARVGAEHLDSTLDDLCLTYFPSLEDLPPFISRDEVREAVLGGIYATTARARVGRLSLSQGIAHGVRALASVHIAAAGEISAAAHALLGEAPYASHLRAVEG
ncbi:MAG: hypothetical protein WCE44_05930 [Candidatus Velthaea sp.]|jgi:hypothetical protein